VIARLKGLPGADEGDFGWVQGKWAKGAISVDKAAGWYYNI
jgi:hypothetical protein